MASFDLYKAADDFYREFPARRADTIIADVNGTADGLRARMREIFPYADRRFPGRTAEGLLRDASPSVKHMVCDEDGIFRDPDVEDAGTVDVSILLSPARAPEGKSFREFVLHDYFLKQSSLAAYYRNNDMIIPDEPGFENDDHWLQQVFDHESAHVLFAHSRKAQEFKGRGNHYEESVADAYSLIRHYQRFGADTGFGRALILNRARLIPDMNTPYAWNHMTVSTLEAVERMDRNVLMKLTPQESFDLAVRTARANALSSELMEDFYNAAKDGGTLKQPELGRHYADSNLPSPLMADYLEAVLVMQEHAPGTRAKLVAARGSLPQSALT